MIVKKVTNPRKSASKAVRIGTLAAYIRAPETTSHTEKCAYYGARGFMTDDPAVQAVEMIELAEAASRSRDPITHYVLSYGDGERPTPEQIEEALDIFLEECGRRRGRGRSVHDWTRHQVMYALHADTGHYHVHLVLSRVDPDTERAVKIDGGWDVEAGHRAGVRIEEMQGWRREKNKRYRLTEQGELERVKTNATELPRQPTQRQIDAERRTGEPSAARTAIERAGPLIAQARSWAKLHAMLGANAMRYELAGSGATVAVGDVRVKASRVARGASLRALEARLGPYEPAEPEPARAAHPKDAAPIIAGARSWAELHAGLRTPGLVYEPTGSGARVHAPDGAAMKASEVARGASLRHLETRLGPFVPDAERDTVPRPPPTAEAPAQDAPDPKDAAPIIAAATSWRELHEALAAGNYAYDRKGSGAEVRAGERTMKASQVSRHATLAALERRLGPYEPPAGTPSARDARPNNAEPDLWDEYWDEHAADAQEFAAKRRAADEARDRELAAVRKAYEEERVEVAARDWRQRGELLNLIRATLAHVHREERKAAHERHRKALAAVRAEHPRWPSFAAWRARRAEERGEAPAQLVPREERRRAPPTPRRIEGYRARRAERRVEYLDRHDEVAFRDHGHEIDVRHNRDEAAVLAALRPRDRAMGHGGR